jgi:ABC-2 type transport system permease protein
MTLATARRVLLQLRHDPRTVALIVVVPSVLMTMLRYVFNSRAFFSHIAPALLGFFPFLLLFLIASITTLRERTSGTLERLMTTPMGRLDLLLGYALAFTSVAAVQVGAAVGVSLILGMHLAGALGWLLLITFADALLGLALGLLASAFARTEFQAVQFMPVVVLPQLLLCGLFEPRGQMATALRYLSNVLPLPYAVSALRTVAVQPTVGASYLRDLFVVVGSGVLALVLAAATLTRQT